MKLVTGQKPFTILVANLWQGSDPSRGSVGNPEKVRTGFTIQHLPQVSRGGDGLARSNRGTTPGVTTQQGLLSGDPAGATATITVDDNDFTDKAFLFIGPYVLTSGEDFTVGGSTGATATAIATAIGALPGITASPSGSDVNITVRGGPAGDRVRFDVLFAGSVTNYTLAPANGYCSGGSPSLGAPTLLP